MQASGVRNVSRRKRAAAYIACGLFLILADVLFWARIAWAAPEYTPYANSVVAQSGPNIGTANNAVGKPDGKAASFLGINSSLTLDMGEGEEGTNGLKVYFGALNLGAQIKVDFLDSNQEVIGSATRLLSLLAPVETFQYDWRTTNKAYRFVRITSLVSVGLGLDAVEALGFIGSSPTQDTDGDGIPDREDSSPLVPASNMGGGGGNGGGNNNGNNGGGSGSGGSNSSGGSSSTNSSTASHTTTTTTRTIITTTSGSGTTPVVNNPPAADSDKDGDGMDDSWEVANGLDPTNKNDASADPDGDGLNNLREYQLDTNPKKADTDGDGIPDGWEVDNGLNARQDDALEDPDGDGITNLGEYRYGGKPYSADRLTELAAAINRKERWWSWVIMAALLVLAAWSLRRGLHATAVKKRHRRHHRAKQSGVSSSLPPL